MSDRKLGPLDEDPLPPLQDDPTLVTGMGGGDDPIVDGVEVESDLEDPSLDKDTLGVTPSQKTDDLSFSEAYRAAEKLAPGA